MKFQFTQKNESLQSAFQKVTEELNQITCDRQAMKEKGERLEKIYEEQTKELQTLKTIRDDLQKTAAENKTSECNAIAQFESTKQELTILKQENTVLLEVHLLYITQFLNSCLDYNINIYN